MNAFKLPMRMFNDYWIDCIYNNIIGALSVHNEDLKYLACRLQFNYYQYLPNKGYSYETISPDYLEQAWMILGMENSITKPNSIDYFYRMESLECPNDRGVHETIKALLAEGRYLFVDIDRAYFPGAAEFRKERKIHPTFLYGYNDDARVYYLSEDCVTLGVFKEYEIAYDDFFASLQSVDRSSVLIKAIALQPDSSPIDAAQIKGATISRLERMLTHVAMPDEDGALIKHCGLASIQYFADNLHSILPPISNEHIELYIPMMRPYQYQEINMTSIQYLGSSGVIDTSEADQLMSKYAGLKNEWEIFKNQMFKYLYQRSMGVPIKNTEAMFSSLREMLVNIYGIEKEASASYLQILQRAHHQMHHA
ncbi:hypothetical protein K0T92_04695 [Paenibacillus oenotherae]|uniref:Butirosin biosynthesis protein H N-terminal domain-containing protein n=1 Tax=Paenibacillus oenotherae TaxID=1435645 RepID=A0ABS7D2F3_9BACL|nr:hypothetical protein [Paenibacillus oenotherae]MBW7474031.1 hypothetical protein [Paenibacillus oenotherae]